MTARLMDATWAGGPAVGIIGRGHESQCQTPVCWAATLLAVGCPG
jgi:hypothetical protein